VPEIESRIEVYGRNEQLDIIRARQVFNDICVLPPKNPERVSSVTERVR